MSNILVVTMGGGSRGLGKSLLNKFSQYGCDSAAFHRREDIKHANNYFLDLDSISSITSITDKIESLLTATSYDHYLFHFVSGGGLQIDLKDNTLASFNRVLLHNLIFPSCITSTLFKFPDKEKLIDLFYYSSAVVKNHKGSPYYVSSKSALEAFFRSSFLQRPSNIRMYLLRLGFVDIEHKYYHKLSKENPNDFHKILLDNLPSLHFTTPNEISDFALEIFKNGNMMNGLQCDLSGGHSWK